MADRKYIKDGVPLIQVAFDTATYQPPGWTSNYFTNASNEKIFYAKIPAQLPPGEKPRGSVVLTTGYNDSIYYYYDTIGEYQKRGFDIYAMDWASQGASEHNQKHFDRPSTRPLSMHARDLDRFVTEIVQPVADRPLILSTHSMGGHIAALYLKDHPGVFDKAIIAAPMLDLNTSVLPRDWFHNLAHTASSVGLKNSPLPNWRDTLFKLQNFNPFRPDNKPDEPQTLSSKFREAMKDYQLSLPTWGWVDNAYDSIKTVTKPGYFKDVKTEILFVSAGKDELVDNNAIARAAKEAPNGHLLHLPTSRHGVWETGAQNQATLWNEIDRFTGARPYRTPGLQVAEQKTAAAPVLGPDLQPAFG